MIKTGIIGAGNIAINFHVPELKKYPDKFQLVAFADIDKDKLQKVGELFQTKTYQKAEDLLADKGIDLIIICTRPHSTHAYLAIESLKAGKNVIVEKPMCITSSEAKEMIKARDKSKKVLTTHQSRRWDIDFLDCKQVVEQKLLGELKVIKNIYLAELGKIDSLYELGSHMIDQTLKLAGGLPEKIVGTLAYPEESWDKQGFVSAHFLYKNGLIAEMSLLPVPVAHIFPHLYLAGIKGTLVHEWVQRREDSLLKHMKFLGINEEFRPAHIELYQWKIPTFYENVYDAITKGKELLVKPEEGLEVVLCMEAIIESSRLKKVIDVI